MNYRLFVIFILVMALFGMGNSSAFARDDISEHRECVRCGMDRKAYGFSRMLIVYEDGTSIGVCSLHCAVVELDANKGRTVRSLLVADRKTRLLIDAEKAVWVMGGKKRGVMTERPKWAFATEDAAGEFIDAYGGTIVTLDEVLHAAREDAVAIHKASVTIKGESP